MVDYYNRYTGEYSVDERDLSSFFNEYSKTEFMPEESLEKNYKNPSEIQTIQMEDAYEL